MINNNFTFIIPAAGKSKRFYNKKSKIFYRYKKKLLIEHVIEKCIKISREIFIVSNKKNYNYLKVFLKKKKFKNIKVIIQKDSIGMGHAVHLALKKVKTKFSGVIWADQIYLKKQTILKSINFFLKNNALLTFPVFKRKNPYVLILRDKKTIKSEKGFLKIEIEYKINNESYYSLCVLQKKGLKRKSHKESSKQRNYWFYAKV